MPVHLICRILFLFLFLPLTSLADSLGQATIKGTTYDIVPSNEAKKPAAKFKLADQALALVKIVPPTTKPSNPPVIATPSATQPTRTRTQRSH